MLSKNFKVCDLFSRAETFTNEVAKNSVQPEAILQNMRLKTLEVTTFAGGALNVFYTKDEDFNLTSIDALIHTVDFDVSFYHIVSVTVPWASLPNLPTGEDGIYHVCDSREAFQRQWRNKDYRQTRSYYLALGNDISQMYVRVGDSVTEALDKLTVTYKRTPDVSYTLDEARDLTSTMFLDVPDFFVPHLAMAVAVDTLRQSGISEKTNPSMANLVEDQKAVSRALGEQLRSNIADLKNQNKDH